MILLAAPVGAVGQAPPRKDDQQVSSPPTLTDAHDLFTRGAYDEAVDAFRSLVHDSRWSLAGQLGLARCRLQTGAYQEAITDLLAAEAQESAAWHYLLARLYRVTGLYQKVLGHTRRALQLDEDLAGARLLLADTLDLLGRREKAIDALRWFDRQLVERAEMPRDAEWVTSAAVGFMRYSVLTRTNVARRTTHVLHEMLQTAYERLDRAYWPARIAAADLLRKRYNNSETDGSLSDYLAALRINPNLPQAHTGIGEVALEGWNFEEVERRADKALAVNPRYAPAIHLIARKLLIERRYLEAAEACGPALAVNPNDVVARSIMAAAAACRYDEEGVARQADLVAAINPRCALFYRTMGDALGGIRQYAASQRAYRSAIEFDPTDANARTELGVMYMQWGREQEAGEALEGAWALDPFNERTKFTLDLLDMIEHFARVETEHFVVKYDPQRDPGIGDFLSLYLEGIYDAVTGDYDTPLAEKTIIEVFPTHRAFGVRITGKPWIHTIGACTGRVIALASPRDPAGLGAYDVARVLKHEFTHTVTLAATRNRIPHWLTEGLAVYQEDTPRSFAWWNLLVEALRRDRLFTLESIDWGFIRPKRPTDRQMAYAQSEWMCEYIVERFGYESINAMLDGFKEGRPPRRVFSEQFGIEPEEFDDDFQGWASAQAGLRGFDLTAPADRAVLRTLSRIKTDDAGVWGRLAKAELDRGDHEAAMEAARRALEHNKDEPKGLDVLVSVLALYSRRERDAGAKRRYQEEAVPHIERLLVVDPDGWVAPKFSAEIALRRGEYDRAIELFRRLQRVCPMDPASWQGLAGIFLERGQDELALPQLMELAETEHADWEIPAQIARISKRRGRLREALYWYRRALHQDPFRIDAHQELGNTAMQAGDASAALQAFLMLTRLAPNDAKHFANAALAANKMGDKDRARKLAQEAVRLDPDSPVRALAK